MPNDVSSVNEKDKKSVKRIPNPPRKCIFCGNGSLTKEHIIAKWMRPYISDEGEGTDHYIAGYGVSAVNNELSLKYLKRGILDLKGQHRSRTLKVVCGDCNNKWMGLIQTNAKPSLQPMLQGKWSFLSRDDQRHLSAWAALHTIIWEQANQETVSLHQPERDALYKTGFPTGIWTIWVGMNLDEGSGSLKTFHRALSVVKPPYTDETNEICNFQMTTVSPGKTFFLTMSDNLGAIPPFKLQMIKNYASSIGLRQIWPTIEGNIISNPYPSSGLRASDTRTVIEQITKILNI